MSITNTKQLKNKPIAQIADTHTQTLSGTNQNTLAQQQTVLAE
ncbi:MAG: hypothetical protein ACK5JD_16425 [Mangrovibacterium sp.]